MSNSRDKIARPMRLARMAAALLGAAIAGLSPQLWAERGARPGLLLGGGSGSAKTPASVDPLLPTGSRIQSQPRPRALPFASCGLSRPVCIHHDSQLPSDLAPAYLGALEEAHALLVGSLGLPAPLPDLGFGPTPGLDLYLMADAAREVMVLPDPRWSTSDQSSAYCQARPSREELKQQATRCVAEALLFGLDAAETPHLRRAVATYLSQTLQAPSTSELAAIDTLQANPQLCVAGREVTAESAGAALFFHYLDRRLGALRPGALPAALLQLSRARTAAGQPEWHNEPDAIDVLRHAFDASRESFDDFLLSFAVERAFLGSRDNGRHNPELSWLRDAGRVRFDWVLAASSLPRRVAPRRPIEPFGAAYSWLELDRVTLGKTLAFRANWEAPSSFRWTLVAVDARGDVLKRFDLPYVQNATSAERTIEDHDGAVGLLIVGINLGGVDLAHPLDPDHEPFEPHGFTVYLAEI